LYIKYLLKSKIAIRLTSAGTNSNAVLLKKELLSSDSDDSDDDEPLVKKVHPAPKPVASLSKPEASLSKSEAVKSEIKENIRPVLPFNSEEQKKAR